jgi:hypothetical protein
VGDSHWKRHGKIAAVVIVVIWILTAALVIWLIL